MLTLQLGTSFFNIDAIFTYPIDFTGDGGAWSTDFELPATPEALLATGCDRLMGAQIRTPVYGHIHNGGPDAYPCKVYVRGYHDDIIECYLTLNVLPEMFDKPVAQLVVGNFSYTDDSEYLMDFDCSDPALSYETHDYINGCGYGQANGAFPSKQAAGVLARLMQWAGGNIDTSTIPSNLYITPNIIYPSPESSVFSIRAGTSSLWSSPSYYARLMDVWSDQVTVTRVFFRMKGAGHTYNTRVRLVSTGTPAGYVTIYINNVVAHNEPINDTSWHILPELTYPDDSLLEVRFTDNNGLGIGMYVGNLSTIPQPFQADIPPAPISTLPTSAEPYQWCHTDFFSCIRQTLSQLCSDIAAVTGTVMTYIGGTLRFAAPTCRVVNHYSIDRYNVMIDDIGKTNVAVYANDTSDTPHRDVLRTYTGDNLEDVAEIIHMAADQADLVHSQTVLPEASFVQWEPNGSWYKFTAYGHGYWLGVLDSITRKLVPAVAKSVLLPPATSALMSVEATVYEDVSRDLKIAMGGREWYITEREQDADGVYKIKAILL